MRLVDGSDRPPHDPAVVQAASTARYRVQAHFMALHALAPDDAIEYVPPGKLERRQFDRLVARGVIRTAMPAYFWLDLDRLDAVEENRRRKMVPMAIGCAIIAALLVMLFYDG